MTGIIEKSIMKPSKERERTDMTIDQIRQLTLEQKLALLTPEEKIYLLGYIDRILAERAADGGAERTAENA